MLKKTILLFLLLFYPLNSYGATLGSVKDNNNGNKGDILINTGELNGKRNDIGTWTNIKDVPELKGEKGDTGATGENGSNGKNGENGKDGVKGDTGQTGKGLKDRYELQIEGRLFDTQKTTTSIYAIQDFNNNNQTLGIKFTWKFGKSYEEKEIEKLKEAIKQLKK